MSDREGRWLPYLMLLLLAAMIWAGKTKPADGLWCAAFATMLLFASVGRSGNRQDRADGLGPKDEHAVAAASGETPKA